VAERVQRRRDVFAACLASEDNISSCSRNVTFSVKWEITVLLICNSGKKTLILEGVGLLYIYRIDMAFSEVYGGG